MTLPALPLPFAAAAIGPPPTPPPAPALRRGSAGDHARPKLGLVLGAGGARGFAHVGVIEALTSAGYAIDAVSGTSAGAIVAAMLALGRGPDELRNSMRRIFSPESVELFGRVSLGGGSPGRQRMIELLREECGEQLIERLPIPLTIMAVDLDARRTAALRSGPVWEALAAATALPGTFAPWEIASRRMIDAVALSPLPAAQLTGADVRLAIDVLGAEEDPCGPDHGSPGAATARPAQPRLLAALGELIELVAGEASRVDAKSADLVIRPRLGPSTWRDFSLADEFVQAGRLAAEAALPALSRLLRPSIQKHHDQGVHDATSLVHA